MVTFVGKVTQHSVLSCSMGTDADPPSHQSPVASPFPNITAPKAQLAWVLLCQGPSGSLVSSDSQCPAHPAGLLTNTLQLQNICKLVIATRFDLIQMIFTCSKQTALLQPALKGPSSIVNPIRDFPGASFHPREGETNSKSLEKNEDADLHGELAPFHSVL